MWSLLFIMMPLSVIQSEPLVKNNRSFAEEYQEMMARAEAAARIERTAKAAMLDREAEEAAAGLLGPHRLYLLGVSDNVTGETFNRYQVQLDGPMAVVLISREGDADLYIAGADTDAPTWETKSYAYNSATCGVDIVYVSDDLKRPLNVAVYGHPSHPESKYSLRAYCNMRTVPGSVNPWENVDNKWCNEIMNFLLIQAG